MPLPAPLQLERGYIFCVVYVTSPQPSAIGEGVVFRTHSDLFSWRGSINKKKK